MTFLAHFEANLWEKIIPLFRNENSKILICTSLSHDLDYNFIPLGEALALARDMEVEIDRSFPKKKLITEIVNATPRYAVEEHKFGFSSAR